MVSDVSLGVGGIVVGDDGSVVTDELHAYQDGIATVEGAIKVKLPQGELTGLVETVGLKDQLEVFDPVEAKLVVVFPTQVNAGAGTVLELPPHVVDTEPGATANVSEVEEGCGAIHENQVAVGGADVHDGEGGGHWD